MYTHAHCTHQPHPKPNTQPPSKNLGLWLTCQGNRKLILIPKHTELHCLDTLHNRLNTTTLPQTTKVKPSSVFSSCFFFPLRRSPHWIGWMGDESNRIGRTHDCRYSSYPSRQFSCQSNIRCVLFLRHCLQEQHVGIMFRVNMDG